MSWAFFRVAHRQWGGDFDLHMATVWALMLDPWSPPDPIVGDEVESAYFTPYTLLLGLAARTFGLLPLQVFEVAALGNTAILLWTFRRFSQHFGTNRWLPVVGLLGVGLLWGIQSPSWSGFLDLGSLSATLPYPSLLANALMFLTWDAFLHFRKHPGSRYLLPVCVCGSLALLIHPFTGVNTTLGLIAFAISNPRAWNPQKVATVTFGAAISMIGVVAWPYFAVSLLLASSGNGYDLASIHSPLVDMATSYWGMGSYGLALLGVPALILRLRRPLGYEMLSLCILAAGVVGLAVLTGAYEFARSIPVVLLPLQLSLSAYIVEECADGRTRRGLVYAAIAAVAAVAGLYGGRYAFASVWPPRMQSSTLTGWWSESYTQSLAGVDGYLDAGDVAVVDTDLLGRGLNSLGVHTLNYHMPYPFALDNEERAKAQTEFFSQRTSPQERRRIADHYNVTCVVAALTPWMRTEGSVRGFSITSTLGDGVHIACKHQGHSAAANSVFGWASPPG